MGRETKKKYLGGLFHTLDEAFMNSASRKVLDTLQIRFANFGEKIERLSGGQRQAVAIARAVYWQAKLMIMDEPTNNLGVVEQHKVLDLIGRLREEQVPVVLISHTLPDVFAVTKRIVVMHRGRKVAEKQTSETNSREIVRYMVGELDDTRES
jgi:ABC-type sugar transport system ATPase subunit